MPATRLILDPPASGPWNMAVDEMLLARAESTGEPTLRFYTWAEPTLSLGYFQRSAERATHRPSRDCPLVRRASGGGAILHDRELTYSFSYRDRDATVGSSRATYAAFHETLVELFRDWGLNATLAAGPPAAGGRADRENSGASAQATAGLARAAAIPFLCFQHHTPGDVLLGSDKVVGSAQRRHRAAILQHGSILLARSDKAPELPGLCEFVGRLLAPGEVLERWRPHLARRLGSTFESAAHSLEERREIERIAAERFSHGGWTQRR